MTSLFGAPGMYFMEFVLGGFQEAVGISKRALSYGRFFFGMCFIVGFVMILLDKDGAWGPSPYQITAIILVITAPTGLIVKR